MNETPAKRYYDAFMAYLKRAGPPNKKDVPDVPEGISESDAREIRWHAYGDLLAAKNQEQRGPVLKIRGTNEV